MFVFPRVRLESEILLELFPKGTIFTLSRDRTKPAPSRSAPSVKGSTCVHSDTVRNDATGEIDSVKCTKSTRAGWLCYEHEHKGYTRPSATPKPRDLHAEAVECVLKTEAHALTGIVREVVGLKTKIQFVFGLFMKTDPHLDPKEVAAFEAVSLVNEQHGER